MPDFHLGWCKLKKIIIIFSSLLYLTLFPHARNILIGVVITCEVRYKTTLNPTMHTPCPNLKMNKNEWIIESIFFYLSRHFLLCVVGIRQALVCFPHCSALIFPAMHSKKYEDY